MNTVAFGELSPGHIPVRHEVPFPYALAVLSRQANGDVYVWTGGGREDLEQSFKWMSVTKALVSTAFWVQSLPQPDGQTLPLDTPVPPPAPPRVTLRDLLAHCAGLPFDNPHPDDDQAPASQMGVRFGIASPQAAPIAPFTKRIYSNYSFEMAASFAALRLATPWTQWVTRTILHPLGMNSTKLVGSPAWGATGPIRDLAKLAAELLNPTRTPLRPSDIAGFTRPVHPGLRGVLPGYGHHRDNLWGTGVEIHGHKTPHYLPPEFPPEVFGHFGQSGSFIWVDFDSGAAGAFLGAQNFSAAHKALWPEINTQMRHLALSAQG